MSWATTTPTCLALALLTSLGSGCDRVLKVPAPPDLEPLAATYDAPEGELRPGVLIETLTEAARRRTLAEDIGQLKTVTDVVEELRASDDLPIDIDGGVDPNVRPRLVANLRHICEGPVGYAGEPDAEAHGTLLLTLVAGVEGIRPGLTGSFDTCQGHFRQTNFLLNGQLSAQLDRLDSRVRLLARLEGRIETDRARLRGDFDFRVDEGGDLEVRVPLVSGNVIVGLAEGGRLQILRDRVATWLCEIDRFRCEREDNGDVMEAP